MVSTVMHKAESQYVLGLANTMAKNIKAEESSKLVVYKD